MRQSLFSITLIFSFLLSTNAQEKASDFLYNLSLKTGKGSVTVIQSDALRNAVIGNGSQTTKENGNSSGQIKAQGYRISVYSGNDGQHSKTIAYDRAKEIAAEFEDLTTYVSFKPPFWRLRIGDFRTQEEASGALGRLKHSFPSFSRELFIVRDEIILK